MMWICKNGHLFEWIRKGKETKPNRCPICGSKEIDVIEG